MMEELQHRIKSIEEQNQKLIHRLKESEMSSAVLYEVIDNFYKVNKNEN